MKVVVTIARILMGFIFVVLGFNGFFFFLKGPMPTGLALTFFDVMIKSHYGVMVFGVQIICGILLLLNRYVPLAIVTLAAVLVNILTYHITMLPSGLPIPIFVLILWFIVAWSVRDRFTSLLAP